MAITTAMAVSFKTELMQANHCFNATITPTGSTASGSTSVTSVSSLAGVSVGMGITGTGVSATVVAMPTTASLTLSAAATATNTGVTLTIAGDAYLMALIKSTPGRSYGATTTNYTDVTTATTDEVSNSGTNYTLGGTALTNVTAVNDGASVAWTTFSPNPSWATATFSTAGCLIYNNSKRGAGIAGRAVSVHDFGGVQSVSAGTLTILIPAATNTTALLRLS